MRVMWFLSQTLSSNAVKAYITLVIICLSSFNNFAFSQPILVFNTTGQPPLNTAENNGFMDEVTREALKRIGYKLVINRLPAERGLRNSNSGEIDGEMSRIKGIDKTYKNLVMVPEKIMDWEFMAFSKNKSTLTNGWQSLDKKEVAFITGWKILENNVPKTSHITKTRDAEQLFRLLKKDRSEYILYERWAGNLEISKSSINNAMPLTPPLATKEMFIYLHKKHLSLIPVLSQALVDMKKDGTYQALVNKHLKS